MKFHKLAKYFPILEGNDFDLLVESIRKNGQREAIVMHEGEILDGINRWRACEKLGIEPEYKELPEGTDPLQFVVDMNIRRRHMDTSQRAMLATEMLPEFEEKAKERKENLAKQQRPDGSSKYVSTRSDDQEQKTWKDEHLSRDDAAKVFGVSGPSIQRAKRVKEHAPDRVADIVSGKTTVSAVDSELRMEEAKRSAEKGMDKAWAKEVKEVHRGVGRHYDWLKAAKAHLELTVQGSRREGWFSPESINILRKKHEDIRGLLTEIEESING